MAKFKTADVLGISTGYLLGDVDGFYKVAEFLIGGPVMTHELALYAGDMQSALRTAHPELKGRDDCEGMTRENYAEFRDRFLQELGDDFELNDNLNGCLGHAVRD